MTQEERELLVDLFGHDGWKLFIKELGETRKSVHDATPTAAQTNDQWQFARGQLFQMDSILNFEQFCEHAWKLADEAAKEDIEESDADPF